MFKIGVVPNKAQNTAKDADVCPLIRKLVLKPYQSRHSLSMAIHGWSYHESIYKKVIPMFLSLTLDSQGAFELGVLEGICKNASLEHLRCSLELFLISHMNNAFVCMCCSSPDSDDDELSVAQNYWHDARGLQDLM